MENGNSRTIKQQSIHPKENCRGLQINPVGHHQRKRLTVQPFMVNIRALLEGMMTIIAVVT